MKIMMIGAHPDDLEIRGAGLALKYLKSGHEVYFLVLCNGNKGHHILSPEQLQQVRAKEAVAVCKHLGLTKYDLWEDMADCSLEATLENRRRLIRSIRNISPDLVVSHRPCDYHADHRAAGQLVQDAAYMLIVPHECPDAPAMKEMPVIMYFEDPFSEPRPFRADIIVDISSEAEQKVAALDCSPSQVYEWLPYSFGETVPSSPEERRQWLWREFRPGLSDEEALQLSDNILGLRSVKTAARFRNELLLRYGEERGYSIRFAEAFEVCEYGRPLDVKTRAVLFPF